MKNNNWSNTEIELIKSLYPRMRNSELVILLGRTIPSIEHKSKRLGLVKDLSYLAKSRSIDRRKYCVDDYYFEKVTRPDQAYILGFIAGDGNVSKEKYRLRLQVNRRDLEVLEYMRHKLGSDAPIKTGAHETVILSISSYSIVNSLAYYNIIPAKSDKLLPPKLPVGLPVSYIRGLFDADGCICLSKDPLVSVMGTQAICGWVREVLIDLGIGGGGVYKHKNVYTYSLGGRRQISKFAQLIYDKAEFFLGRKYNKFVCGGLI